MSSSGKKRRNNKRERSKSKSRSRSRSRDRSSSSERVNYTARKQRFYRILAGRGSLSSYMMGNKRKNKKLAKDYISHNKDYEYDDNKKNKETSEVPQDSIEKLKPKDN